MSQLPEFYRRRQKLVLARWQEYLPALTLLARNTPNPTGTLRDWRNLFHLRLQILFDSGVRWVTIRNLRMDDPVTTDETFSQALASWRERRARYGDKPRYAKDFEKRYAKDRKEETKEMHIP